MREKLGRGKIVRREEAERKKRLGWKGVIKSDNRRGAV